jgi:hypothetical protein
VLDPEVVTADRVRDRDVGGAIVGEDSFDGDAVAAIEGDRATEEADCGRCFLVAKDLGVGEAAVVVDRDVDVLPAFLALVASVVAAAGHSVSGAVDPAELLHVDVDQLARA